MIKDRGNIKWTSMMLPEHVEMLRQWVKEDQAEPQKELDEQQLEFLNEALLEAMEFHHTVTITYYSHRRYQQITGIIHSCNEQEQTLHLADHTGKVHSIPLNTIIDIY
ncbi:MULTISPECIES: YolD-like family protein [Bacillus]|jgi:ABC-type phosphate transport system auxiliary subunit|uniref:YolD-like family protein n=1 Tax=Bacillus TaxID=1386 RepID=UPI0022E694E1|nr:YolD-like family protein [Bacillus smithii]MED1487873.1 YolD-like family protein [Bacillus smithii]MED4883988.1 YolD-like family protein [Bacillus smithii]MED4926691.1 YolD-like family protein [Bacillus smithii]